MKRLNSTDFLLSIDFLDKMMKSEEYEKMRMSCFHKALWANQVNRLMIRVYYNLQY